MQAAVRDRYGSPDVVELREIDVPVPSDDQVLVRVQAASVNRADLDGIEPRPQFSRLFMGLRAPRNHRIGLDVAGVVDAVGAGVTRFKPGDRVFADLFNFGQGTFAEYVAAPAKAFEPIPAGMSFEDASTLPHSAVLAVQGLRLRDGRTVGPGDKVLVSGGAGNVGPFAVQVAKSLGAEVTGVDSGDRLDFMRSLGADHVIDYRTVDYTRTGERYDWILDVDSHHSIFGARRALEPNGVYVTLGGAGSRIFSAMLVGPLLGKITGKRMNLLLWWKPFDPEDVTTLTDLMAAGKVRSVIDRRFPLSEIVEALRYVDDGRPTGKVVVIP
jgi:NADPH:quinone reductase-like Zn-dependent oxidoreductase